MILRYGDWDGHSRALTLFWFDKWQVALLLCCGLLSCCNTQKRLMLELMSSNLSFFHKILHVSCNQFWWFCAFGDHPPPKKKTGVCDSIFAVRRAFPHKSEPLDPGWKFCCCLSRLMSGLWSVSKEKCLPMRKSLNLSHPHVSPRASFSACAYLCSVSVKEREAYAIGLHYSPSFWNRTTPSP